MKNEPGTIGIHEVLPPLLIDGLRILRSWLRFIRHQRLLRKNLTWKNRFINEIVYIIANGPSVNGVDRSILKDKHVIVMNNFHLAEWKDEVHPVAHCFGEPPSSPSWVDPSDVINGTDSLSYWFNYQAEGLGKRIEPGKQVHYVLAGYEPRIWRKRRIQLERVTLGYQTTAQMAIEVALYMGFRDIRLLGFDHDWLASPEYSKHFYSDQKDPEDTLGTLMYYEIIRYSVRIWEGYFALKLAAEAHDATIVNMTDGSFLDVFPRRKP